MFTEFRSYFFSLIILNFFCSFQMSKAEAKTTIFITGGAGFIGSNFLQYMFDKYDDYHFTILDSLTYAGSLKNISENIKCSNRFEFIKGSIEDEELVNRIMSQSDFVVHFAAESDVTRSIHDDHIFLKTNVLGTRCLMSSLIKHRDKVKRFIHISSSEVYGTAYTVPMAESHSLNPRSPYAASKVGADRLVYSYYCTYDAPVVTFRSFNNYGESQNEEKMIPHFIISALKGIPITIEGTGHQKRDWVHTIDFARAIDRALHIEDFEKIKGKVINIGTSVATSVIEVAYFILDYLGLSRQQYLQYIADRPGQVDLHIADIQLAEELLNWSPEIDLQEGIISTIKYYQTLYN